MSPPVAQGQSDITVNTTQSLVGASFTLGFFSDWSLIPSDYSLTLNAGSDAGFWLPGGDSASFTISFAGVSTAQQPEAIVVSMGGPGGSEITANNTSTPEPSSVVVATFGALGLLGYSFRRRIMAKLRGRLCSVSDARGQVDQ